MDKRTLTALILKTCGHVQSDDVCTSSDRLTNYQASDDAWKLSMELLSDSMSDLQSEVNVQLATFSAMTLKTKIKSDSFDRLSVSDKEALKAILIKCLSAYATNRVVRTQICLCLVYCVLKKPDWNGLLDLLLNVINEDARLSDGVKKDARLDVFTLLAEEISNRGNNSLKLGRNRREEVRSQLMLIESEVMKNLGETMLSDPNLLDSGLRCFMAWCDARLFSESSLMESRVLIEVIFPIISGIKEPEDCDQIDTCGDALSSIFDLIADDLGKYRNILIKLNEIMMGPQFRKIFSELMAAVNSEQRKCEDEDSYDEESAEVFNVRQMDNMCRAYCELCRALVNIYRLDIPDPMLNDTSVLALMLEVCPHSNYRIANQIVCSWNHLAETLSNASSIKIRNKFRTYLENILSVTIDVSVLGVFATHRETSLRRNALDLFEYLVEILGGKYVDETLCRELSKSMNNLERSEAIVFLLQSCPPVAEGMPSVVESIVHSPRQSLSTNFVESAVEFLGSLGFFLKNRPELLSPSMEFLFSALRTTNVCSYDGQGDATAKWSTIVSISILQVCTCCSEKLAGSIDLFVNATVTAVAECPQQTVVMNLIRSCAMLLVHLRGETLRKPLYNLTSILYQDLIKITKDDSQLIRKLMYKLDRICAVYRTMFQSKSMNAKLDDDVRLALVHSLSSVLPYILSEDVLSTNEDVVETACNLVRYAVRAVGEMYLSLLEGTVNSILNAARKPESMPSCLLYLASVIVDEFSGFEQSKPFVLKLTTMNSPLISNTIARLRESNDSFRRNPDLVDDFFRLCKRLTEHYTVEFVSSDQFVQCLMLGIESLQKEKELRSATSSLIAFVHCVVDLMAHENQLGIQLRSYLHSKAIIPPLVAALIRSACLELSSESRERVGLIMFRLKTIDQSYYQQCVDSVFKNSIEKKRGDLVILTSAQCDNYSEKVKNASSANTIIGVFDSISELAR